MQSPKKERFLSDYDFLNFIFEEDKNFSFMNHGFFPVPKFIEDDSNIFLKSQASMYFLIVDFLKSTKFYPKNILDVGCGRGGGTNLIKNFFESSDVFGCDINYKNIEICKKFFENINFEVKDSQYFNYNNKFDVILNIESSHCYDDLNKFFNTVYDNLSSNGYFFYADVFEPHTLEISKNIFTKHFVVSHEMDITTNVINSLIYSKGLISNYQNEKIKSYLNFLYDEKIEHYTKQFISFRFFILKIGL